MGTGVLKTITTVQGTFTGAQTLPAALEQAAAFCDQYADESWCPDPSNFLTVEWHGGALGWKVIVTLRQITSMS